jgi:quercetin dioxygenase-like cupin family protein
MDKRERIAASGGVSERTPRPLAGKALIFDFLTEANALRQEDAWRVHGHNARTLVKNDDSRVVLIALKAGARMQEHQSDQHATVQVLLGTLKLHLPDKAIELRAGQLLALDRGVSHDVEAIEDSVLLLSMGWAQR